MRQQYLRLLTTQVDRGIWGYGVYVVTLLALALIISRHLKAIGPLATALWLYVAMRALYIVECPVTLFGDVNNVFVSTAGQCLAEVILIPLAVLSLSEKGIDWFWRLARLAVVIEMACIWSHHSGLLIAQSFGSAFIALCLPFMPLWIIVPAVITILTHHGSTAYLVLIAEILALALRSKRFRWYAVIAIPTFLGASYAHTTTHSFDSWERIAAWKRFMGFWWGHGYWVRAFGIGPGSFMWMSMVIDDFKNPIFLHMHSDWQQIPWELGILGLILALGTWASAVMRSWENPRVLAAVFGTAAFCTTYHPTRFGPTALSISVIFAMALKARTAQAVKPEPSNLCPQPKI